ncbi:hypothetical protein [Aliikangiella maris]|uniref:Uncharacterized protein n=2 Tax=Aliikangiella maris TaxID=3162458 RepID=A0ABV3MUJ6_9GAMM
MNKLVETYCDHSIDYGLIPFDYLMFLLRELPKKQYNIESLMPWNFNQ